MANLDSLIKRADAAFKEELRKKIEKQRPPNSFTRREYADAIGIAASTAAQRLRALVIAGKLRRIQFPQVDENGHIISRSGYQWVGEPASGKSK